MSKLKDTLLMMAAEKETFKIGDKTFQIIEVKSAEQSQPDYSHLVGKWVKYWLKGFEYESCFGKWFRVNKVEMKHPILFVWVDGEDTDNSFRHQISDGINNDSCCFDLTNPKDENPDEVKKILVPSEIVISEDVDGLNLHFGNNQALYVYKGADGYGVLSEVDHEPIQCELIKCERAELVKGDLAFRTNVNEGNFDSLSGYCAIIDKLKYCYIDRGEDVTVGNSIPHQWYKLQPIEQ